MSFHEIFNVNNSDVLPKTGMAPVWVPSPSYRGTVDIVWSCLITLSACVYTATHLNVPPLHKGKLFGFWRKAKWVGVALFAPEIVLYTAIIQFFEAWNLVWEMNRLRRKMESSRRLNAYKDSKPTQGAVHNAGQENLPSVNLGVREAKVCDDFLKAP